MSIYRGRHWLLLGPCHKSSPTHHKAARGTCGLCCPTRLADGSWCPYGPEAKRKG